MRLLLLAVLLWGFAGSPQRMEFAPIAGQVLDAVDGAPIVGATVAYRGAGLTTSNGKEIDPTTLRGEVMTGADGRYTLPQLPPGSFRVKAMMDGYFAAGQTLQPRPMHDGKVIDFDGPPGFHLPDGVLRLRRNEVNLQAMSDDALKRFARHSVGYGRREVMGSQFSQDGRRLGFLTLESGSGDKSGWPIEWRCKVWAYDLKDGGLIGADLKAPVLVTREKPDLQPGFCDHGTTVWLGAGSYQAGYALRWVGDELYVVDVRFDPAAQNAPPTVAAYALRADGLKAVPLDKLPLPVQELQGEKTKTRRFEESSASKTLDGLFALVSRDDNRGDCSTLSARTVKTGATRRIASGCLYFNYLLDGRLDTVLYTQPVTGEFPDQQAEIGTFALKTGERKTYRIPGWRNDPQLLTEIALPDGRIRLAYKEEGDCDPAASDYTQPGQPEGALGSTPNDPSVCFVTLPGGR